MPHITDTPATKVIRSERGWNVVDTNGDIMASFPTNAQAWRFVDLRTGEPKSRSEHVTEWIMIRP